MNMIKVFNQTNRLVTCTESGISIAPLKTYEVNADDQIAAFAIEQGWLVVLSYPEEVVQTASESEPIQVEEPAVEPGPEETQEVSEEEPAAEESTEEVQTQTRTRKKTSPQVKES
jgi:hypothetical protein